MLFNQLSRRSFVKGSALGLAAVAFAGSSLALADEAEETPSGPEMTEKALSTEYVADNGDGTRTVTDMVGREVVVPAEITSIATFGSVGVLNAFVECMGKGGLIVNEMPENFTKNDRWAMQYKFAPQIAEGPVLETADGVDIEQTLVLNPDVCITMTEATAQQLQDNGLACIVLTWGDTEDVKVAVSVMGQMLGVEDRAKEYCDYFDEMVQKAADATADLADEDRVAALYGDVLSLSNPHIISEWWISAAGGRSVSAEAHTENSLSYTMEQLLSWQPEVIFSSNSDLAAVMSDSNIQSLPAVENGRVYAVPTVAHVWGNRTVEQPLTVLWAMNKMYPDRYSEEDLVEDIKYFYSTFFLYDMSDEEVRDIIHYGEEEAQ